MKAHIRLFGVVRERARTDSLDVEVPGTSATVGDVVRAASEDPRLTGIIDPGDVGERWAVAVNREYARPEDLVPDGAEVAIIPPVSGGQSTCRLVRIDDGPLDPAIVTRAVADPSAGAIVAFHGITREVDHLDYEVYTEMVVPHMRRIVEEEVERTGSIAGAVVHRSGRVSLGDPSVVIAVSSAHRGPAFEAASEILDRIKEGVPVWKREVDGECVRWVDGHLPSVPQSDA